MPPSSAQIVYDFLRTSPPASLQSADAIIGFGHFDLRIARQCGELWEQKWAPKIIFTGGVGAGSADLAEPEAEAFAASLHKSHPQIPVGDVLIEPRSTNTGENVRNTLALVQTAALPLHRVILVATPFRQRRVVQTWRQHQPHTHIQSAPPKSSLAEDVAVFAAKGENPVIQLPGEIDRLHSYAARGWIAPLAIPPAVQEAARHISL